MVASTASRGVRLVVPALGVVLLLLAVPVALRAQWIRGRVTSASNRLPLVGALITLEDSIGIARLRTVSTASGAFAMLAPRAGRWQLRVAAIGYDPSARVAIVLADTGVVVTDVAMMSRPFQLPTLIVSGSRGECAPDPLGAPIVARLIEETETALRLVEATVESQRLEFTTEVWEKRVLVGRSDTSQATELIQSRASWPIASADVESLQREGFVQDTGGVVVTVGFVDHAGPTYFGPDAAVLFAPWFRASHCFAIDARGGGDSLVVSFIPKRAPKGKVDVSGALVLDRMTLSLRRLVFQYVGLPRWVPGHSAGGEIGFKRLTNGLWVADSWRIKAPILFQRRRGTQSEEFGGWAEGGGRVVDIVETVRGY